MFNSTWFYFFIDELLYFCFFFSKHMTEDEIIFNEMQCDGLTI